MNKPIVNPDERPTRVRPDEMGLKPRNKIKSRMVEFRYSGRDISALSSQSGIYISPSALSGFITGRINPYLAERRCLAKILKCAQRDIFDD